MASTFARAGRLTQGYRLDQVDTFFTRARVAYEEAASRSSFGSRDVRRVGFDIVRGGYEIGQVDAALDRMEDAFARREREAARARVSDDELLDDLARRAGALRGRLLRPDGERFHRSTGWVPAYDVGDVDELCRRLRRYFEDGDLMSVDEVRRSVFRTRRGSRGYAEPQVDAFLDRAVEIMVSVD